MVGIGNEFYGDDAAGIRVARSLERKQRAGRSHAPRPIPVSLQVIDAGLAPENVTGAVRRFAPDLVILVDAALMGEPAGAVRWLDWQETTGLSAATHALPPYMVARYLASELSCEVALIGIQPHASDFGSPLSLPVRRAVRRVCEGLIALLLSGESSPRPAGTR